MTLLQELISKCKGTVYLTINAQKSDYQTATKYVEENKLAEEHDVPLDIINEMIARDIIVALQFYPDTPIGFYLIYHYDVNEAVKLALTAFE